MTEAHVAILWGCGLVTVTVFVLMLHSIATFRRVAAAHSRNATGEVLWALVPIAIVIATAAPAVKTLVAPTARPDTAQLEMPEPRKAFHDGGISL